MEAKDYPAACPKFEESFRLNRGSGTLLNLAVCNELLGKTATAWAEFQEGLQMARRDGRADREELAQTHIDALGPKLSHLRVVVPAEARARGLLIRRNGVELGEAAWNEPIPVDPGEQVVELTAPGRVAARETMVVGPDADAKELIVPVLKQESPTPKAPSPPISTMPKKSKVPSSNVAVAKDTEQSESASSQRLWGGILAGTGVVGLGVGTYFSIRAVGLKNDANSDCPDSQHCDPAGIVESQGAAKYADVSTAVVAGSAVLTGLGVYLFLSAPSGHHPRAAVQVVPNGATARLSAVF